MICPFQGFEGVEEICRKMENEGGKWEEIRENDNDWKDRDLISLLPMEMI